MPHALRSLCVFCGSSPGRGEPYLEVAAAVGRALAEEGIRLVYGGGSVGLMGRCADACLEGGGEVVGVITHRLMNLEVGHRGCTELHTVDTMLERKSRMAELSDAFLSLPGGIGTLDELFEMLTWSQLDVHRKPNALLNVAGYYDHLLRFLDHVVSENFLLPEHRDALIAEDSIPAALASLRAWESKPVEKWVERHTNRDGD